MAIEPQNNSRRIVVAVAGICVFIVGVGALLFLAHNNTTSTSTAHSVSVVVSIAPIQKGDQLTLDNVKSVQRSSDQVPDGAVTDVNSLVSQQNFALVPISKNTPITTSLFTGNQQTALQQGQYLNIAAGNVAMAIPVDQQKGVGGYIQPEDRIDIIVDTTGHDQIHYGFEDVRVISVGAPQPAASSQSAQNGQTTSTSSTNGAAFLVVEFSRAQAEAMAAIVNSDKFTDPGSSQSATRTVITYVLRSHSEYGHGNLSSGSISVPSQAQDPGLTPQGFTNLFTH